MAEEQHKFHEASNHVLCANNCGFFGSNTTLNLCSKCYKHHCLNKQHLSTAKLAVEQSFTSPESVISVPESSSSAVAGEVAVSVFSDPEVKDVGLVKPVSPVTVETTERRNRCGACRKRVGLTGFTCRCGMMFCGTHRYPEKHECSFDFKTVGKEAIAKANPVIKGVKLEKI